MSAAWSVASDHLRSGSRESAEFPTDVKEVGSSSLLVRLFKRDPLRGKGFSER